MWLYWGCFNINPVYFQVSSAAYEPVGFEVGGNSAHKNEIGTMGQNRIHPPACLMELPAPERTQQSARSRTELEDGISSWEHWALGNQFYGSFDLCPWMSVCECECVHVCVLKKLIQKYRWRKLCISNVRPGCIISSESTEKVTDVYITIWLFLEELPNDLNSNRDCRPW